MKPETIATMRANLRADLLEALAVLRSPRTARKRKARKPKRTATAKPKRRRMKGGAA